MKLSSPLFQAIEAECYTCTLAQSASELKQAQRLRFEVFNLELNEGLETAYATGRDEDPYDAVCDHLIVRHKETNQVIGTYRLQSGRTAAENLGYSASRNSTFHPTNPFVIRPSNWEEPACTNLIEIWQALACYGRE